MKAQSTRSTKSFHRAGVFLLFLAAALFMAVVVDDVAAKSLYVIADIYANPTPIQAYDIGPDGTLAFQAQYGVRRYMLGAVGLALDSDSGHLFITYEASENIQLVDAVTMTEAGTVTAPDASDLAGIVYDHAKGLVYCVDRHMDNLYVYDWDPNTVTLTHVPGSPFTLTRWINAYGIALDEIDGILYVTDASTTIRAYSTSNWSLVRTISVSRPAISIAVDVMNGFLYSGAGYMGNRYLTQYHLATGTEQEIQVEPDAGVIGLGVDADTGLIYVSTGIDIVSGGDNLRVYDPSLSQIDVVTGIGNPTGLVIPGKDIGYNPFNLVKNVIDGIVGQTADGIIECVGAGENITYEICFGNNNGYTATDVIVVDTLPVEVSFVSADDDGLYGHYDPNTHTYMWLYPSLLPGSEVRLDLVVRVNDDVAAGTIISNFVTINSNQTPPSTTGLDVITTCNPFNISKSISGSVGGQVKWVDVNDIVTYEICFDTDSNNDHSVTNVLVVDILPNEVTFVTADEDGTGQYEPETHTYTWSYSSLAPGFAACLDLVVQVNQDVPPGTTITNCVIIDSNETPPAEDSVDITTYYNPLNLSKEIVGSVPGEIEWVDANETITYSICFDNNDNDEAVTDVSIVDLLPEEASFVSADGDGVFGQYDPETHTYTWSYSSLPPGFSGCLDLAVQVNQDVVPGLTITNSAIIDSTETPQTVASVDCRAICNPLNLSKIVVGEVETVDVNEIVTYIICFDNNSNISAVTDVSIVDTLPDEVSFVSADGDGAFGQYDPETHEYTWTYPSLSPGPATCLQLIVRVNPDAAPGATLRNSIVIDSSETPQTTASVDCAVKCVALGLSKSIVEGVETADVNEIITYSICFDNNGNVSAVTDVSVVDFLPEEASFVSADGDGVFGQYDPNTHTYTWSYPSLAPGSATCLNLVAQVNQDAAPGTTFTNSTVIDSTETPQTTASVDCTVTFVPLNLSKSIVGDLETVDVNEIITYSICFDNNSNVSAVTDVSIVDTLPDEVSFVSADGDGVFGQYDPGTHEYTWTYPSLSPGPATCLQLIVRVNPDAAPGATLTNSVVIDSRETPQTTASVGCAVRCVALGLSKSIVEGVETADVNEIITYSICFDNNGNVSAVTDVSVVDNLPDEVSFVSADGDGVFGHYDPETHEYTWSYPSLAPGSATCLNLVAQVNQDAAPGTTFTNSTVIDSTETPQTTASVDCTVTCVPLNLSKIIVGEVETPDAGEIYSYLICFDNNGNVNTVTEVSLVDTLPDEVSFVAADGDGAFGEYDPNAHTYAWSYSSLSPGSTTCLELSVRVNDDTAPETTVSNSVTIVSKETPPATASVDIVTCESPLRVDGLSIIPNMIRRRCTQNILAILELPRGIGKGDIEYEPLVLYPGEIPAERYLIAGTASNAKVLASFPRAGLLDAVPGYYGPVKLTVTGKLKSGRSFYAEQTVHLTRFTGG